MLSREATLGMRLNSHTPLPAGILTGSCKARHHVAVLILFIRMGIYDNTASFCSLMGMRSLLNKTYSWKQEYESYHVIQITLVSETWTALILLLFMYRPVILLDNKDMFANVSRKLQPIWLM